jgi:hypothetical protein
LTAANPDVVGDSPFISGHAASFVVRHPRMRTGLGLHHGRRQCPAHTRTATRGRGTYCGASKSFLSLLFLHVASLNTLQHVETYTHAMACLSSPFVGRICTEPCGEDADASQTGQPHLEFSVLDVHLGMVCETPPCLLPEMKRGKSSCMLNGVIHWLCLWAIVLSSL